MTNPRLADIYIRIYHKKPLTMDDLFFLFKYDPECFEKTCINLFYKVPAARKLAQQNNEKDPDSQELIKDMEKIIKENIDDTSAPALSKEEDAAKRREMVGIILENLKKMDKSEFNVQNVSAEKVKELLGNLYMEMLFPHNNRDKYFHFENNESGSSFNQKA